jgi:hypothetical protein
VKKRRRDFDEQNLRAALVILADPAPPASSYPAPAGSGDSAVCLAAGRIAWDTAPTPETRRACRHAICCSPARACWWALFCVQGCCLFRRFRLTKERRRRRFGEPGGPLRPPMATRPAACLRTAGGRRGMCPVWHQGGHHALAAAVGRRALSTVLSGMFARAGTCIEGSLKL